MSHPLLITHPLLVTLVAEGPKNTGPDFGKASPIGLLVVVLLLIGVFALVWSMNRHLKKLPESFDASAAGSVESNSVTLVAEGKGEPTSADPARPERELKGDSGG